MGRACLACVFTALLLGVVGPASADPIDNPGTFTISAIGGYIKVGSQRFDINPDRPPTLSGSIGSDGLSTIPQAGIVFPDAVLGFPVIGDVTVRIEPISDGSGDLNAATGDADATISVRVRLINGFLGSNCRIEPVTLTATTGISGPAQMQGVSYDQIAGTATLVSNDFSVPRSMGCSVSSLVDGQLGLPSAPPNNELQLNVVFNPILTGT